MIYGPADGHGVQSQSFLQVMTVHKADLGVGEHLGQTVVKGIQVLAVPGRKFQLFLHGGVEAFLIGDLAAVYGDDLHGSGFSVQKYKTLVMVVGIVD